MWDSVASRRWQPLTLTRYRPSRERRRRRRRSTAGRSSLQSQDAEEEQDMPAILSNNSSRCIEITRSTSRAPRDRSIEVISEQACAPSNRFGRIVSGRNLGNVKIEPNDLDRGYGYDDDDRYLARQSRDDSQGQAKRRRTGPSSLRPALAPGELLRRSQLYGGRSERSNSRRSFSSTRDEL